jgi:Tfp pilus assembly protein PilZ
MSSGREDRRKTARRRCRVRVRFWNDELEGSGFTCDISSSGMYIETDMKLEQGTRLHFELKLETGAFFAEGVIARTIKVHRTVRPVMKPGVGVRFMDLTEAIRKVSNETPPHDGLELDLSDIAKLATVYVRDIKRGGLFVTVEKPPEVESTVTIRVLLPEPHGFIEVRGVVIHVMEDPSGVAINLLEVDQLRGKLAAIITE